MGPIKDPVRVHEKACDDYRGLCADGALPESCVRDVLRGKFVCDSPAKLLQTLRRLLKGFETTFNGSVVVLETLRLKNLFNHERSRRNSYVASKHCGS